MFTLITNWYHEPNAGRRAELLYCLNRNLEQPLITGIWLLAEGNVDIPHHSKIRVKHVAKRAKFKDMMTVCNEQIGIVVLANADIYFNDTLAHARHIHAHECFALTRWDVTSRQRLRFYGKSCSQDAWVLRPPINMRGGDYSPGKPGCDNKLAWELAEAGLKMSNPSKTIKACHLHLTGLRRYTRKEVVPGPYLTLQPINL